MRLRMKMRLRLRLRVIMLTSTFEAPCTCICVEARSSILEAKWKMDGRMEARNDRGASPSPASGSSKVTMYLAPAEHQRSTDLQKPIIKSVHLVQSNRLNRLNICYKNQKPSTSTSKSKESGLSYRKEKVS